MRILIHACKQREAYVREFLVPELKNQGFDDVDVFMDPGRGNLEAYLESYRKLPEAGYIWHLEDDVVPDSRFYWWSRGLKYFDGIICGFGAGQYYGLRDFGYCIDPGDMFLSFPCIRIPCGIIKGFLRWFDDNWKKYADIVKSGKEIDTLFREYVIKSRVPAFNFMPCMVEHVDDILGGSIVNPDRIQVRAVVFDDPEQVERVRRWKHEQA